MTSLSVFHHMYILSGMTTYKCLKNLIHGGMYFVVYFSYVGVVFLIRSIYFDFQMCVPALYYVMDLGSCIDTCQNLFNTLMHFCT